MSLLSLEIAAIKARMAAAAEVASPRSDTSSTVLGSTVDNTSPEHTPWLSDPAAPQPGVEPRKNAIDEMIRQQTSTKRFLRQEHFCGAAKQHLHALAGLDSRRLFAHMEALCCKMEAKLENGEVRNPRGYILVRLRNEVNAVRRSSPSNQE